MDKIQIGTLPNGLRFLSVERDGRRMPVLNARGMVDAFRPIGQGGVEVEKELGRALAAMTRPEKLKDVTPC